MFKNSIAVRLLGAALIALFAAGCLISGTFVIVDDFTFTAKSGFYFYRVDLTQYSDWDDHKDQIDQIDAVGAEFYISSTEPDTVTFNVYVDAPTADSTAVPSTAVKIIDQLEVPPGLNQHITYVQSLGFITHIAELKTFVKAGKFNYYGTSSGNLGTAFKVDSGKVIVTFSASGS